MNHDIFFAPGITIRTLVHGRPRAKVVEQAEANENREESTSQEHHQESSSDAE